MCQQCLCARTSPWTMWYVQDEVTSHLFSTYWKPKWAPYPHSHSPLSLIDGCPAQAFHAWLRVSVCVFVCARMCVCCSQEASRRCGGCRGAERVFHGSCTSVYCISLGVVFQLWEKGITPYHFFSLSHFLPHYAHNKGHEAHTYSQIHKVTGSQTDTADSSCQQSEQGV